MCWKDAEGCCWLTVEMVEELVPSPAAGNDFVTGSVGAVGFCDGCSGNPRRTDNASVSSITTSVLLPPPEAAARRTDVEESARSWSPPTSTVAADFDAEWLSGCTVEETEAPPGRNALVADDR